MIWAPAAAGVSNVTGQVETKKNWRAAISQPTLPHVSTPDTRFAKDANHFEIQDAKNEE